MTIQAFSLEKFVLQDLIDQLQDAFNRPPLISRTCVKILNLIVYNLPRQKFTEENLKNILIIILKGLDTQDLYLKNYLYLFLIELTKYTNELGIITINSIAREIDSKTCYKNSQLKNLAMRSLFCNLPPKMVSDFEKYLKQTILNEKTADNSIILCSEYYRNIKITRNVLNDIRDYHSAFFNSLPINKYSGLIEIKKAVNEKNYTFIFNYLNTGNDDMITLEICKTLCYIDQEIAAKYIEKTVQILRLFLKADDIKLFSAIKILSQLSTKFPGKVSRANKEIEDLIHSSNSSISMLAILILLKTGNEESVKKLAIKLEPYLSTMSNSYKIMAIDTMEKLSKTKYDEYVQFLQKSLMNKGDIYFKKYIITKIDMVLDKLNSENLKRSIISFLCSYLEDPEYYQLTMEILGILGKYLENQKDLMHIYNRLILDNAHVQNCALQTLYDLDEKFDTLQTLFNLKKNEFIVFLMQNKNLKKGPFNINEFGDLKSKVLEYISFEDNVETNTNKEHISDTKMCRPIQLTNKDSDFSISVIKEMTYNSNLVTLNFNIKNNLANVVLNSGRLRFSNNDKEYTIDVKSEGKYSIILTADIGDVFNGIFEYQISLEDDCDDTEVDSISLNPFDFTILDFAMPCESTSIPSNNKKITIKLKYDFDNSVSKIIEKANLHLIIDTNNFTMIGKYNDILIIIKGELISESPTIIDMQIYCDDDNILNKIINIFE